MFEWTLNIGTVITAFFLLVGFVGSGVVNSIAVGRYFGASDRRLDIIDTRMDKLELTTGRITELLVAIAQQKSEMTELVRRFNDLQQYGSHRLAEVVDQNRTQIMAEVKERLAAIQHQLDQKLGVTT